MTRLFVLLCLLFALLGTSAFMSTGMKLGRATASNTLQMVDMSDPNMKKIDDMVKTNKIVLFMKGTKLFPQCGFSNTAVRILDAIEKPFETVNVLEDENIRNGVKTYSSWPTIPQLYVDGEFIGGCDIMIEMYESGELAEMIEVSAAS